MQYHAPVYRQVAGMGVDLEVVYGSNFSLKGYKDKEFGASFAWDKDLMQEQSAGFWNQGRVIS